MKSMNKHIGESIKAVLFDHDDTLVGTIDAKWAHHKHVARTFYGKELSDAELKQYWGKPLEALACLLYGTDDVKQAMDNIIATHEAFPKDLFEATIPTLKHIKAAGKLIGIVTATTRFSFEHDLTLHEVPRELIDYTQTADDTLWHKPDPRVFVPALEWLDSQNVKASEVVYVGDGLHDMKAALGAGFSFIGVETGLVTAEQFREAKAKSVPTIEALIND